MAVTIKQLVNGDVLKTAANLALTQIQTVLRSFPGGNLQSGTVALGALATQRTLIPLCDLVVEDLDGLANGVILDGFECGNVDGGVSEDFTIVSYSIWARSVASSASNAIDIYKNTVATGQSISLGSLSSGVPDGGVLASPVAFKSGDAITLVYAKSGAPTLDFVRLRLWGTHSLVTTG